MYFTIAVFLFSIFGAVIPVNALARKNLKSIRVVIDPGHGGYDGGAIAPNGLKEKFVNLSVAKYLANYLKKAGATVSLTRTSDRFVSLPGRAAIANKARADCFIAVHQNSAPNGRANGTETYFYHQSASHLAKVTQNALLRGLKHPNRGVHKVAFAVIRRTKMKGILTEAAFMSNPKEAKRLKSSAYRQKQAHAIFNGLKRELGLKEELIATPVAQVKPKVKPIVKVKPKENNEPAELKIKYRDKFGFERDEEIDSSISIPFSFKSNSKVVLENSGGKSARVKIVFNDLLGNKKVEKNPVIEGGSSYKFISKKLSSTSFLGSVDVIKNQPKTDVEAGLV